MATGSNRPAAKIVGNYRPEPEEMSSQNLLLPPCDVPSFVKGYYLMDNGDGQSRFKDKACSMQFTVSTEAAQFDVAGCGDTEFGEFYVKGAYDARTGRLIVERTYCDPDDATLMSMPGPKKKPRARAKKKK